MMVDTGATITILTKKWCEVHSVPIRNNAQALSATAANGSSIPIIGTASFKIRLSPSLELELEGVAVQGGSTYNALLGMDVL